MEIIYRNLSELQPHPDNPRKPKDKDTIKDLAEKIKANPKFFEARPILLSNRTGKLVIIGGERRTEAAMYLGMDQAPTILIEGLTEDEESQILIEDNTHAGIWDETKLEKWSKQQLKKWNVETKKSAKPKNEEQDEFEKKFNETNDSNCEMPIVPDFFEHHECFIIVTHNTIDESFVRDVFGLNKNYKSKSGDGKIRKTNVIDVESLRKLVIK